jgi:hypothetical protein
VSIMNSGRHPRESLNCRMDRPLPAHSIRCSGGRAHLGTVSDYVRKTGPLSKREELNPVVSESRHRIGATES